MICTYIRMLLYVCMYMNVCTLLQNILYILMYICMYHTYVGVHISSQYLHIHIMYTSVCTVCIYVPSCVCMCVHCDISGCSADIHLMHKCVVLSPYINMST